MSDRATMLLHDLIDLMNDLRDELLTTNSSAYVVLDIIAVDVPAQSAR